jgi:hypothetical protein
MRTKASKPSKQVFVRKMGHLDFEFGSDLVLRISNLTIELYRLKVTRAMSEILIPITVLV